MGKYGRLFTATDIDVLLVEAGFTEDFKVAAELRADAVRRTDERAERMGAPWHEGRAIFRFPTDEPLFLLRGQDAAASATVGDYLAECERRGAGASHLNAVAHAGGAIMAWQAAHPDRVKIPD